MLVEKKKSVVSAETNIEHILGKDFYDRLKDKNLELVLDLKLSHFQRQCHGSNNFIFEKKEFF